MSTPPQTRALAIPTFSWLNFWVGVVAAFLALAIAPLYLDWGKNFRVYRELVAYDPHYAIRITAAVFVAWCAFSAINTVRRYQRVGIWRQYLVNVTAVVSVLPIVFAALSYLLFAEVGQMHEVYLAIVENDARPQFLFGVFLLAILSTAIFSASLALTRAHADSEHGGAAIPLQPGLRLTRILVALLCGVAPLLGLLSGFRNTHNLLATTVEQAWAATRKVSDSGPLSISAGKNLGLTVLAGPSSVSLSSFIVQALLTGALWVAVIAAVIAAAQGACWLEFGRPRSFWPALGRATGIALIVVLGFAAAMSLPGAWSSQGEIPIAELMRLSMYYMAACLVAVMVMLIALWQFRNSREARFLSVLACAGISLVALVAPALTPDERLVDATRALGPLAMTAIELTTIFTLFYALSVVSRRTGVPVILSLIALILVRAWLASGETTKLDPPKATEQTAEDKLKAARQAEAAKSKAAEQETSALVAWLDARRDRRRYYREHHKPFPIYLVAAQGGGIYAASATMMFLARLEDDCPGFSQHVYAISGVSGGSIGAAGYSALVRAKEKAGNTASAAKATGGPAVLQPVETKPHCGSGASASKDSFVGGPALTDAAWIATQDHLSPVLAMVAPDYAEKTFWVSARRLYNLILYEWPRHTRANALESSLACAFHARPSNRPSEASKSGEADERWQKPCASSKFDKELVGFASHFAADKPWPALLLNTTFVETGQRVAFSPLPLRGLDDADLLSFNELTDDKETLSRLRQIKLAEAAVISARFPGLMPAYTLDPRNGSGPWNFVDGGYSDNSGAATAAAVMHRLRQTFKAVESRYDGEKFEVRLIVLTSEVAEPSPNRIKGTSLADTVAPVEAVLNVRSTLAVREIAHAVGLLGGRTWNDGNHLDQGQNGNWDVGLIGLDQKNFSLELGWTLSRTTNLIVSLFVARPEYCPAMEQPHDGTPRAPDHAAAGTDAASTKKADEEGSKVAAKAERIAENACLIQDIIETLR